jgi:hypothetical protein
VYSYRQFIDLQSDGILSHEEKLALRNLEVMRQCVENKEKIIKEPEAPKKTSNRKPN